MELTPDVAKLRRFALTLAVILLALVLADVKLDVPLRVSPLGVPLVINRPDLLTISLQISQDASGSHVQEMRVPRLVRAVCLIEDLDFLLPVLANVVAIGFWARTFYRAGIKTQSVYPP